MTFSSSNVPLARKGKSLWVQYAIRRRLGEKKPFVWFDGGNCYLFVEEGVFSQKLEDIAISPFVPYMWTFVDVVCYQSGIPTLLTRRDTSHFNIYTTPVPSNIWKHMRKTTYCAVAIMNPWTREEIAKA